MIVGTRGVPRRRRRTRIETLSDLVFGLALSIGALTTIGRPADDPADLVPAALGFGLGFIVLIVVWLRYTRIVALARCETPAFLALHAAMLFLVCVEPYLFNFVFIQGHVIEQNAPALARSAYELGSMLLAIDLGLLLVILAGFEHLAIGGEATGRTRTRTRDRRFSRNAQLGLAACFLLSAWPSFFDLPVLGLSVRVLLWMTPLAILGVLLVVRNLPA